ncbi:hypothetical protein [Microvirga thermotolerans]|uniref:Uncharacterized protein n=1 Tax=Microvirga thermotolerans TaxID=2651334 RepID=A0A5P9JXV1_9HYPH|nr:hypothetical protein [Microvirga thermotolerans]QFU16240.1 hypothetical protein GDR74_08395 [Microvirga thermotolerans]
MTFGRRVPRWTLGAIAGALALGAAGAKAAPLPVGPVEAPATLRQVQFFYDGPDYDDPPPPRYYGPPPRYYRPPPPPPGYGYYYDREAAKEYMKDYRRAQKEIAKDQIRAWNRRNGF